MNQILQSGSVVPGHLAAWLTDGVIDDAGVTIANTYAKFLSTIKAVNFNQANVDNLILVKLPATYGRWRCSRIVLSNPSGNLSTATCGVFTGTGGTGTAIVSGSTAITITTNMIDTDDNAQSLTINNQNTEALSDTAIYFRLQTPQGNAAYADVSVFYEPLPLFATIVPPPPTGTPDSQPLGMP
jgi:hypothetical protein